MKENKETKCCGNEHGQGKHWDKDSCFCPCHSSKEVSANYFEQVGDLHCFRCHRDYKDAGHSITCKERLEQNRDGGAMSCGRLHGKECEFRPETIMVNHGDEMHDIAEAKTCPTCIKVDAEFEQAKKDGTLDKILHPELEEKKGWEGIKINALKNFFPS